MNLPITTREKKSVSYRKRWTSVFTTFSYLERVSRNLLQRNKWDHKILHLNVFTQTRLIETTCP